MNRPVFEVVNPITGEQLCAIYENGESIGLPTGVVVNRIPDIRNDGFSDGYQAAGEELEMNAN